MYRLNKQTWDILRGRKSQLQIETLDVHAVVINVTIQGNRNGTIVDTTPQAEEQLGLPEDG